jgi:hypothetical protein
MNKTGIDQEALVAMFSQATAKQGEALRKAVSEATLKALQGRELTLKNIRGVLKSVTAAASTGAERSGLPMPDVEAVLGQALAGMDAALLKAVEAHRRALEQFVGQGADLQEKQLKGALANLEQMEDMFFAAVGKAAQGAGAPLQGPWEKVLENMKLKGTSSGMLASQSVEQMLAQTQTALRDGRSAGLKAAQAMLQGYSALVSGVLIGLSEGLQPRAEAPAPSPAAAKKTGSRKPAA